MWTLFIISLPMGFDEPKVTRYDEYNSEWSCNVAIEKIEKKFKMDEKAICIKTGNVVPGPDVLY